MKINSHNKTILIFADPHQELDRVREILSIESPDITVSLGDYFDSFNYDLLRDWDNTCRFLEENVFKSNFFTLKGNHDIQYFYKNPSLICSGYNRDKDAFINGFFSPTKWSAIKEKFLWYIWVDDFLCTHAGLHPSHLPPNQNISKKSISNWLDKQIELAQIALDSGQRHWLYGAGLARLGSQDKGGIDWLDFNQEFEPISGLKQIVGHTPGDFVRSHRSERVLELSKSKNLCIDSSLNEYLLIRNKKVLIKKFSDLWS